MAKPIQLTIPEPCNVKHSEMESGKQGLYCNVCCKNVINFIGKTDHEVYEIITHAEGEICGRLLPEQLKRPIRKIELSPSHRNLKAIAAGLISLFSTKLSLGHSTDTTSTPRIIAVKDTASYKAPVAKDDLGMLKMKSWDDAFSLNSTSSFLIGGQVLTNDSVGIACVEITIHDSEQTFYTDSNGCFSFQVSYNTFYPPKVRFKKEGYENSNCSITDMIYHKDLKIVMGREEFLAMAGGVCVTSVSVINYSALPLKDRIKWRFKFFGLKLKRVFSKKRP